MPAAEKQRRSEHTNSDLACTRCRERKIRCGRERPQCGNCERDDSAICVFQNPVKRVNHLKLLCDSVDRVQDRLSTMESHLTRLTGTIDRSVDRDDPPSAISSQQASPAPRSGDEDDDDSSLESSSLHMVNSSDLHVFRNQADMVDRYHGPSSLFVLCNNFRLNNLNARNATEPGSALQEMLQTLCKIAGSTEPFPSYNDQSLVHLLPKQQAIAAINHFFQHIDYATDIFVQKNLLANLERIYSQPIKPKDEAWAICFKTIVLLVLGREISAQARSALFGDFARSFLPSSAVLINSRLLTVPRLINVQTLILLSVAAQQFDPHGWAELLFTNACMLARTMGLHHVHLLPPDANAGETLERAKVLQSLYSRDKSLCTTRGCVCWLPSDDSSVISQFSAAVERQAQFSDRLRLAMIQDDIRHLVNADSPQRPNSKGKLKAAVQRIEQQLNQYARAFGIFDPEIVQFPRRALIPLEFLATRILALQNRSEPRHMEQVRSDARASCLLLLIALGDQDRQTIDTFHSLTNDPRSRLPGNGNSLASEASTIPFASVLDAFSLSAFFILLEDLLQPAEDSSVTVSGADLSLLRKVSTCYSNSTAQMQSTSYHRKVALIFNQLLTAIDQIKQSPQQQQKSSGRAPPPVAVAEMMPPNPSPPLPPLQPQAVDFSNVSTGPLQGDLSSFSFQPTTPTNSSLSWDNWLSVPSSLGPTTPTTVEAFGDGFGSAASNLFAQMFPPFQSLPDVSGQSKQWPGTVPEGPAARKRRRTHEELDFPT